MTTHFQNSVDITRPTRATVDLEAIVHNYRQFCSHARGARVMPVIKANAYGHGLVEVAQTLQHLKPPCFGVATLEEAINLRSANVDTDILVFSAILEEQIPLYINHNISLTASSDSTLLAIEESAKKLGRRPKVHLKIDTGMERIGVHHYHSRDFITTAASCQHVSISGIYTHFATADECDNSYFNLQLERFLTVCQLAKDHLGQSLLCHAANSAATIKFPHCHLDMVRVGISLYGVLPNESIRHTLNLRKALCWSSRIVHLKKIKAGHPVGYGCSWKPDRDTTIATIPVGYADGYKRLLSNTAQVRINTSRHPVVGNICMDQMMVDVGDAEVDIGDKVELLGASIDAHQLAHWQSSIAYEVLTGIGARVPRTFIFSEQGHSSSPG